MTLYLMGFFEYKHNESKYPLHHINECDVKEPNNCTSNQFCVNDVGSYHCSCLEGYHLDGEACVPNQAVPKLSLAISLTIGISIGLLLLFVGGSWIYWGLQKRKLIKLREKFFQQNGGLLLQQKLSNRKGPVETGKIYSVEELKKATNNYDESRVLGQGGYGTVYKGILPDNKVIAIKKSKIGNQTQIEQFINEIIVLTHINHRNVVKLLGCCLETEVPLLVYEFISKGTLSEHIHDKGLSSLLSWEKRLKIAVETARALAYLHSATSMPIIHRDVKVANILLDDNFTAKVSDFGASRLVPLDQTQLNTLVQGTFGYLDPEYFHTTQLTEKSDVYSISIGLLLLFVGGSWIYWGLRKKKLIKLREKFFQQNGGLLLQQKLSNRKGSIETGKIYSAEELEEATNNYDESRVLGPGGYGTVYKGILPDNKVIAIKKSKIGNQTQIEQFVNEIIVLTHINHKNVVKLLGCCLETEVPLLVYEFISKGTLSEHIDDKGLSSLLSWEKRLKIVVETAGALAYLHSTTSVPIIHRDVKAANILLDDNFTAKVSDFGASRLVPLDQTQLNTLVQGTFGYLDPEYFHTSQLTEKSNVYSFGVVLAELLTGKRALSFDRPEIDRNLAKFFISAVKDDRLVQILEDHIINEGNIEQLKEVANLAKRCLKVTGEDRPSMKEVAMELEGFVIMEKHPWRNASLYTEETEYLLGAPTQSFSIDVGPSCSSSTVAGYDSIRNEALKPLDDGR
ncbi:wall-associated receptor kinase 4 [Quercus suber]|uniref:non-specific serine/threonine protein kinase n=1 Tax=Quercus suber TaxID=58331 RepID=A0AAW0KP99_QUESU